jgi:hypothetical protein
LPNRSDGSPLLFVEVPTDGGITGAGEATLPHANYLLAQGIQDMMTDPFK